MKKMNETIRSNFFITLPFIISLLFVAIYIKPVEAKGLQGCCSHHGGVAYTDNFTGAIICKDGTTSPSCSANKSYQTPFSNEYYGSGLGGYTAQSNYSNSYQNVSDTKYREPYNSYKKNEDEEYKKITWFLLTLHAGMERYYFNTNNSPEDTAFSEIKSNVQPIDLLFFEVNASIPLMFFKSVYKKKRTEHGEIHEDEKTELINENTDDSRKQFFLSVVGGILGFEGSYSMQNFDIGTFKYYRSSDIPDDYNTTIDRERDILVGETNYTTYKQQIDFKYHFNWINIPEYGGFRQSEMGGDFFLGYRYIDYKAPAIIYTYDSEEILVGESLPQDLVQKINLFGLGINNNNRPLTPGFNLIIGLEFYGGYGYSFCNLNDYWYLPSRFPPSYNSSQDQNRKIEFVTLEMGGNIGLIFCLTNSYLITSLKVEWGFDSYLNFAVGDEEYSYSTGEFPVDIFHSIKISGEITF